MIDARPIVAALAMLVCQQVSAQVTEIKKDQWIKLFTSGFTPLVCDEKGYFRQCFKIDAAQCEKAALQATRTCLANLDARIPATITTMEQSQQTGGMVGRCAGTALEVQSISKKISTPKCQDVSNWVK